MARRSFDVFDLIELLTHWHAGRSQRQLADSLGIDRKTIAKYLAPAIAESSPSLRRIGLRTSGVRGGHLCCNHEGVARGSMRHGAGSGERDHARVRTRGHR